MTCSRKPGRSISRSDHAEHVNDLLAGDPGPATGTPTTHRDVAHRKRLTANEPALSEVRIQDRQGLLSFRLGDFHCSRIALLEFRSHQGPEHVSDRPVQAGQLPVHPALGIEAGCEIARA